MKIAIYGDSFGKINCEKKELGTSWTELLEENNTVTNFSKTGSAFMFSYETFLKNYANHDLNIFAVTAPARIYVKALPDQLFFGVFWLDYCVKLLKKKPWYAKKNDDLEMLASIRVYLDKWADWEMIHHIQHVLVNNLWNLAPNTIVLPGFCDSISQSNTGLHDIAMEELRLVDQEKFDKFDFNFLNCKRKCHFSEENNIVIFNLITDAIENNKKIIELDKSMLVKPSGKFEYYVERTILE